MINLIKHFATEILVYLVMRKTTNWTVVHQYELLLLKKTAVPRVLYPSSFVDSLAEGKRG